MMPPPGGKDSGFEAEFGWFEAVRHDYSFKSGQWPKEK